MGKHNGAYKQKTVLMWLVELRKIGAELGNKVDISQKVQV